VLHFKVTQKEAKMPTALPRVNVPFEAPVYETLKAISKTEKTSLSQIVSRLVKYALELAEDLALAQEADKRLASLRRDEAFSSEDLLKWNKSRRKKI
jgi:predicted DNA-binding protein